MNKKELKTNVKRAKENDTKAIEALYHMTYTSMHSMIYRLCANKNDVEDILQEGYVSAFSDLYQLKNDDAFINWLQKTMINAWRMYLRKHIPDYDTTVFEEEEEQLEDWQLGQSLQVAVEDSETNREIWELVQTLPEHQRVCMVLYYYEEMRIDQIAEALGIPEGSVKSRLYYGRLKLRESMDRRGIHSYGVLTAPAADAAASQAMLARILAALKSASDSGTAAAGLSTAAKLALSVAALAAAGGIIGGVAMRPQNPPPESVAPTAASTTVTGVTTTTAATVTTTTTTTITTTTTATTTVPSAATTTAPKLYAAFDYQRTDGGVILTRYTGNEPDVVIPETIDGMSVVAIGENAFTHSSVLRSVTIPSAVRTVGSNVFRECRHLRSASIGGGVNVIGDAAFLGTMQK